MKPMPFWAVPQTGAAIPWDRIPRLPPLVRTTDGGPAEQPTAVRIAWNDEGLHVRFECQDRAAWGTYTQRDDPIFHEEAVEVFLAPGTADPAEYLEFEVSPRGVLWDGSVYNPPTRRAEMVSDSRWHCPGIRWAAGPLGTPRERQDWWAELMLPWGGIVPGASPPRLPKHWRANFYRIERPPDGPHEFTAWSPTLVTPADFHQPSRFGTLELAPAQPSPGATGTPRMR